MGKSAINGPCSIAMLVHQRVILLDCRISVLKKPHRFLKFHHLPLLPRPKPTLFVATPMEILYTWDPIWSTPRNQDELQRLKEHHGTLLAGHRKKTTFSAEKKTSFCWKNGYGIIWYNSQAQAHIWVCLKIVYPMTQWFCWSLSLLNGYFIGGIPHFQTYPFGSKNGSKVMRK